MSLTPAIRMYSNIILRFFATIIKPGDGFGNIGGFDSEHEIAQSGHDTNLYKHSRTAARFLANERRLHPAIHRPGSAHPAGKASQLAHDQNRPDNVFGLTHADGLKLARKAAPLLDIGVSEFMRLRK